ncbi:MAG: DNA-processing protein DprA [Proteobacteria bacterium]|nr:DNA-processing protein DprA [Pseudomonadota bacterium]
MQKLIPWFFLKSVPGIGNHLFKRLLDRFGSPEKVISAPFEELAAVQGISNKIIAAIRNTRVPDHIVPEIKLTFQKGFGIITFSDAAYPALLREIPDPPPYLYVYGKLPESKPGMAIVGSRNASSYGRSAAEKLGRDLSLFGINIVSGMARGIDTAAHYGALTAGNPTTAVLGSGLGCIYPPENKDLFHKISQNGAVISEFPVNAGPEAYNFPLRNRIICGMSLGTVVVEAAKKSGSLITARLAAEQGREVFAVPGSIHSFKSAGTHQLLKDGAKLVAHARDVLEEFPYMPYFQNACDQTDSKPNDEVENVGLPALSDREQEVIKSLGPYPVHIDELSRKLNFKPGQISGILLKLELMGMVSQAPGKYFFINEDQCGKTINHS